MKRLFTSALAILLIAGAAQAQTSESTSQKQEKHQRHGKGGKEFAQLNLSADQKAQLKAIHGKQKAEADAIKANKSLTADQQKTQRKALHEKYKAQTDAVFTADQKAQLAKLKSEHRATAKAGDWKRSEGMRRDTIGRRGGDRMKDDFARKGGAGRGAEMMKELNLTAEQQQKVKGIQADFRTQLESVRNNDALSKDQKKAKFQELMKAQQEQMKTVLTKDQLEKMKSLRKERPAKAAK